MEQCFCLHFLDIFKVAEEKKSGKMLRKIIFSQNLIKLNQPKGSRGLWWWTVVMFNRMDMERTKAFGYDR